MTILKIQDLTLYVLSDPFGFLNANSDSNLAALREVGMTQTQAEEFALRWPEVVDQITFFKRVQKLGEWQ